MRLRMSYICSHKQSSHMSPPSQRDRGDIDSINTIVLPLKQKPKVLFTSLSKDKQQGPPEHH